MRLKTKMVLEYLQSLDSDVKVTAQDVANALKLTKKQVDGVFTAGIKNAGLGERIEDQVQDTDGYWKIVKYLVLTEKGRELDLSEIKVKK